MNLPKLLDLAARQSDAHAKSVKLREERNSYEATYWQRRQRGAFQARAEVLNIAAAKIEGYDQNEIYDGQFLAPAGENAILNEPETEA